MKALLLPVLSLVFISVATLRAQTAPPAAAPLPTSITTPTRQPTAEQNALVGLLSDSEKNQVIAAHTKALAQNPALQTEEGSLRDRGMALFTGGTPVGDAEKAAFRKDVEAHIAKVRAAMIQADPAVAPILTKLEAAANAEHAGH